MVKWDGELGQFGLVTVGAHCQNAPDEAVRAKATSLGVRYSITKGVFGLGGGGIPHCYIFDSKGDCVYDGSPLDPKAEAALRTTVGKGLTSGIEKPTKGMAPLVDALGKGQSPFLVMPRIVGLLKSTDKETAEQAKQVVDNFTSDAQKKFEEADALKESDPYGAYTLLEKIPGAYKGTPVGTKAGELLAKLGKEKVVQAELKARPSLESVRKIDTYLTGVAEKAKVQDLKDSAFLKGNASSIDLMKRTLTAMKKNYPDAKTTEQAAAIGEKYGVVVK